MGTSAIRGTALVGAALLAFTLTGCKASEKVVVDSVETSTWIKCTMGQSFVNELADDDPTQFGALWWDWMSVTAYKYLGQSLCATAPTGSTTSSSSVYSSSSATCASGGSSQIWASGLHKSIRNSSSTVHTASSATPKVTTR